MMGFLINGSNTVSSAPASACAYGVITRKSRRFAQGKDICIQVLKVAASPMPVYTINNPFYFTGMKCAGSKNATNDYTETLKLHKLATNTDFS